MLVISNSKWKWRHSCEKLMSGKSFASLIYALFIASATNAMLQLLLAGSAELTVLRPTVVRWAKWKYPH